jgi:ribonuclease VapC
MSAVTRVECTFVAEGRKGEAGREALELLLGTTGIEIVAVTADQTAIACEAFRRYGKGRHRAALNIGDCFAYALARSTGESLLAKGNDFPLTDLSLAG